MIDRKRARQALGIAKFWSILANLLGMAAVLGAALAPLSWTATILLVAPILLIIVRQRNVLRRIRRGVGGLGRYFIARYLVLSAGVVQLVAAGQLSAVWVTAVVLAACALESERLLRTLNGIAVPYAANLPDREVRNRAAFRYGFMFPLHLLGLLLFVVIPPLAPGASALVLVVNVVTIAVGILALLDVARRIRARQSFQNEIDQVLQAIEPVFYLYWHADRRSVFQIRMWLPYLERIGVPFAIIVRTVPNLREVAAVTDRPVLLRRALGDLDPLIVPSVRVVFYVNNGVRNNHMIRYSQLRHIQLLHGESDKAASVNPVMRMFDRDFVAGQAAIDRFALRGIDMPRDLFRIVGRPQVEEVEEARGPIGRLEEKTVLYAPTWKGYQQETNYSSLMGGDTIVRALLERDCTVVFRPHPYSYGDPELRGMCHRIRALLEEDAARTGKQHLYGPLAEKEMSIFECLNASDAMISDVSSVVGDYLFSHKPLAMVAMATDPSDFVEQFPTSRAAYVLDGDLGNLENTLQAMLGEDPMASTRESLATYYLGDIPRERYAERFVDTAREEIELAGHAGADTVASVSSPNRGPRT